MKTSLASCRDQLIEQWLGFLWRQWSALGVAGHTHSDDRWIIDPEALLLFSTVVARHDARLFDEILDWLRENGSWISLQRLRTLLKDGELADRKVLAAMAAYLATETKQSKWSNLLGRLEQERSKADRSTELLFPGLPVMGTPDPIFMDHLIERGPIKLRGMSQSPGTDQAPTFLIKLRALFGHQARAEVLAWLLSNEQGHPAEIARQTGYFRRSIQIVLNELAESGLVRVARHGREKNFFINPREWTFLLTSQTAEEFPQWITWPTLFRTARIFLAILSQPGIEDQSERFQAIQFREALESNLPSLQKAGLAHHFRTTPDMKGSALVASALDDICSILR